MDNVNTTEVKYTNPARHTEGALKEKALLAELNRKPFFEKFMGYVKLSGPGFLGAAMTLGAGSFASSIVLGASYGYSMLWVPIYSFAFGLFMLALATRFVTSNEMPVIVAQDKYHGKFFGSFSTGIIACFLGCLIFSFGQYALGADAVEQIFDTMNMQIPKGSGWLGIFILSAPISYLYGQGGDGAKFVKFVENIMKLLILLMVILFAAVVFVTGINVPAAIKGIFIPTLPSGLDGIVMMIASLTAVIGVMDWVLFNNGMYSRGYSEEHETLGRFDSIFGGLLPVAVVLSLVSIAFAEAFAGNPEAPTSSKELAVALTGILPSIWVKIGFYIGIVSLIITTMVGLSILSATSFCQSFGLAEDPKKWYYNLLLLAPHIGILGAYFGKPVSVVILVASMQSCLNWVSGNSWYLLGNDPRYLGKRVIQSKIFNIGICISLSILNIVFVTFILSKIGAWPA